jgi:hypothetical protein
MWLIFAACTPDPDVGPSQSTEGPCEEFRTPIPIDELGPDGFTAEQAVAMPAGTYQSTFVYRDGTQTPLTYGFAVASAALVEYLGTSCEPSILAITIDAALSTDDGAFDEVFSYTLTTDFPIDMLSAEAIIPASDLGGAYESPNLDELWIVAHAHDGLSTNGQLVERWLDATTGTATDGGAVQCGIGSWDSKLLAPCPGVE